MADYKKLAKKLRRLGVQIADIRDEFEPEDFDDVTATNERDQESWDSLDRALDEIDSVIRTLEGDEEDDEEEEEEDA